MALKLKYTDEHGILHINMSPTSSPGTERDPEGPKADLTDPKFDTINNRFGQYDLFGGKYEVDSGGEQPRSLFRSRYNSIEEELANTPYAFTTERSLRLNSANNPLLDITIKSRAVSDDASPSKDIEDDRFFRTAHVDYDLFGPQIDFQTSVKTSDEEETPAFTVTQLIHAQDRYFDLSSRQSSVYDSPKTVADLVKDPVSEGSRKRTVTVKSAVVRSEDEAFKVLSADTGTAVKTAPAATKLQSAPASKRKKESSFAIITETTSRPASPRSLPVDLPKRVSPFKGRGFREETSRHTTPKTSAANSRANSPPRRRTNSLSKIDKMATATLPPPIPPTHSLSRPHSPRNFLKENIEEVRELSELNREMHEAEAEMQRKEEEEALLREMADFEKGRTSTDAIRSVVCSRTTSRSNSPNKLNLRSRSNSPSMGAAPASVHYENLSTGSSEYINADDGMTSPVTHKSRIRSVSRSQPQSNDGSPKHSKIPKRQNSVSPSRRSNVRDVSNSRKVENNLNRNQRFISNSTSSINESVRVGSQANDKRAMSKSTQFLNIAHANIKGKPPISPGRGGPPPSNKFINSKRLSPIVGTPSKSPVVDSKPSSARTPIKPSPAAKKPVKTAGNTPATSRFTSRQPSRNTSRDPSPDKRKAVVRNSSTSKSSTSTTKTKPVVRATSTRTVQKPPVTNSKPEVKKPINRTNSMKSLTRTPSTKTLNEKPPLLKKRDSTRDLRANSSTKLNELGTKRETIGSAAKDIKKSPKKPESKGKEMSVKSANKQKEKSNADEKMKPVATAQSGGSGSEVTTQDNETQYDKITNEKGELVILTKKNIVSMTTAAITSQPLEVVTKVTNQLPTTLEKAREKGIFERHSSKDSLAPKEDDREAHKAEGSKTDATKSETTGATSSDAKPEQPAKSGEKDTEKEKADDEKDDKKGSKPKTHSVFAEDNVKLKPLLPPYNNPQVERVKQRIDEILNTPEVSTENIVTTMPTIKSSKSTFKNIADKTKSDIKEAKDDVATKLMDIKDQAVKQADKTTVEIRKEATKIVDSIITPVEEPKEVEKPKNVVKKTIEPIVMVVNEKKNTQTEVVEKMNEALVKGEPEVEVQSSNVSTPRVERIAVQGKSSEGSDSDKSQSNGGFPQSTSTTPKPPARNRKDQKDDTKQPNSKETTPDPTQNKPNICVRLLHKCKKCCPCCTKGEDEERMETKDLETAEKGGVLSKLNCCKRKDKDADVDIERAAGKASIEYENEAQRRHGLRSVLCCGRRRVSDASADRRDSILSDRPPPTCCNRMTGWLLGACRRQQSEPLSASRRQSLFSKNKSLSPTLPPEDTRTKLDASLVEHTSVMRGAIPVLPIVLAYVCLVCNVVVPGLGTIFSGMFCLCFGIPRFGVHDGAKHRIGSFLINLLVGCGQLFTVLFCLVGWGWSIWWGVIMVKISRKYRKLKAEAAAEEAESAPPVTANNHTRA